MIFSLACLCHPTNVSLSWFSGRGCGRVSIRTTIHAIVDTLPPRDVSMDATGLRVTLLPAFGASQRAIARPLLDRLREWDRASSYRLTHFIAISRAIQRRIRECYGRDSTVIYPPVDVDYYQPAKVQREDYYLVVSALVP